MYAYRIFLACAIFASHLVNGSVIPDLATTGRPVLSRYQMDQLGGICFKALNMMLDQTQGEVEQVTYKTGVTYMATEKDIPPNFKRIGTKFYYIEHKKALNWFAAANACIQMGGTLASINSKEELTAIAAEISNSNNYWTGINDLADEGVYKSLASGTAAPFMEWYSGYPVSTKTDKSVALSSGKMFNDAPSAARYFICQAAKDNQ